MKQCIINKKTVLINAHIILLQIQQNKSSLYNATLKRYTLHSQAKRHNSSQSITIFAFAFLNIRVNQILLDQC